MGQSLLVKDIETLVSCDEEDRVLSGVNMLVENGVITYIGRDMRQADKVLDASHMVVYPGLINTHHHLYQIFSRNLPEVQKMELFPWLRYLYGIWKNLNEEIVYNASLVGMGELLKYGCTTCFDHHYVFPADGGDLLAGQFAAADLLGMRFHASRGSMSLSEKDGGLPPDSVVQTTTEILRDSQRAIEKYHDASRYAMHRVALAPCSPFSVTQELMCESAVLARSFGVRLHTHLAETIAEERYTLDHYGLRPLAYMEKLGWLGGDVWFAHGIHFNDDELRLLQQTGTGIAHCPISNMKLASGIARVPDMLRMGIHVGLAVDGSASNDGSNLLEEMRVAYLLHRLKSSAQAPDGYAILKMATTGSAQLLGRDDIGSLQTGMAGDFFLIDKRRLELVAAMQDPGAVLATVGYKQPVDYTVVNGCVVVEQGRLTGVDEERLCLHANHIATGYLQRKNEKEDSFQ